MTDTHSKAPAIWRDHYRRSGEDPLWPSETLIRLLKGRYLADDTIDWRGLRGLDVGCGRGQNLVLLASLGMEVSGTEIEPDIASRTTARLKAHAIEADIRVGSNRALPFDDGSFDVLIAWDVLHYAETLEELHSGLEEYARVLAPNGRFLAQTTGPANFVLAEANYLGDNRFKIGTGDIREGQVFTYFLSEADTRHHIGRHFTQVDVSRVSIDLFGKCADHFLIRGEKSAKG